MPRRGPVASSGGGVAGGARCVSRYAAATGPGRWGAMDPGVVRGLGGRWQDHDRLLVGPGEALPAGPEPGLLWSRAPPRGRVGGLEGVMARSGRRGVGSPAVAEG